MQLTSKDQFIYFWCFQSQCLRGENIWLIEKIKSNKQAFFRRGLRSSKCFVWPWFLWPPTYKKIMPYQITLLNTQEVLIYGEIYSYQSLLNQCIMNSSIAVVLVKLIHGDARAIENIYLEGIIINIKSSKKWTQPR